MNYFSFFVLFNAFALFCVQPSFAVLLHDSFDIEDSKKMAMQYPAVCLIESELRNDLGRVAALGHGSGSLVMIEGIPYILSAKHVVKPKGPDVSAAKRLLSLEGKSKKRTQ